MRHRIDDESYRIRFMPRKPGGIWSQVNLKRFAELEAQGRIAPAGRSAHEVGKAHTLVYAAYERPAGELAVQELAQFEAHPRAWSFFQAQPPGYRKLTVHRVLRRPRRRRPAPSAAGPADWTLRRKAGRRLITATQMEDPKAP